MELIHFTTLIISGFYIADFENAFFFFGISIAQLYKSLQLLYLGKPRSSSTKRRASQANIQFHCLHPPVVCLCVERLREHVEERSVKRARARALNALFCIHFNVVGLVALCLTKIPAGPVLNVMLSAKSALLVTWQARKHCKALLLYIETRRSSWHRQMQFKF